MVGDLVRHDDVVESFVEFCEKKIREFVFQKKSRGNILSSLFSPCHLVVGSV
jgi:hypothetical protein